VCSGTLTPHNFYFFQKPQKLNCVTSAVPQLYRSVAGFYVKTEHSSEQVNKQDWNKKEGEWDW